MDPVTTGFVVLLILAGLLAWGLMTASDDNKRLTRENAELRNDLAALRRKLEARS